MTTIIHPPRRGRALEGDDARRWSIKTRPWAPAGQPIEPGERRSAKDGEGSLPQEERVAVPVASRRPKNSISPTAALIAGSVVLLAGVFGWAAFGTFTSSGSARSWDKVPTDQPYYVAPAKPVIPNATADATAAGMAGMSMGQKTSAGPATASAASSVKLPPMVDLVASTSVTLKIDPPPLGGTYGADGQIHDNFSPAYFSVPAGRTAHVTVYNYDDMWHTFTAPVLGLDVWIRPGGDHPSKTTFTFTAPKTGYYWWLCAIPCDPYAMNTGGYMQGEIHAVKD